MAMLRARQSNGFQMSWSDDNFCLCLCVLSSFLWKSINRLPCSAANLSSESRPKLQSSLPTTSKSKQWGAHHRKREEEDWGKKIRHHHHNHIADDRRRRQSWSQWRRSSTIHSYDEAVSWFSKCCLVDFQWEFHYDRRRPSSDSFAPSFYFLLAFLVFLSFSSLLFSQNCIWA